MFYFILGNHQSVSQSSEKNLHRSRKVIPNRLTNTVSQGRKLFKRELLMENIFNAVSIR